MTDPNQAPARPSEGAVHQLKTWPTYFNALLDGSKTFEVRKADRPFAVGDTLRLCEYDPKDTAFFPGGDFTGRETQRVVTYILAEPSPFAFPGFVVMGLAERCTTVATDRRAPDPSRTEEAQGRTR